METFEDSFFFLLIGIETHFILAAIKTDFISYVNFFSSLKLRAWTEFKNLGNEFFFFFFWIDFTDPWQNSDFQLPSIFLFPLIKKLGFSAKKKSEVQISGEGADGASEPRER